MIKAIFYSPQKTKIDRFRFERENFPSSMTSFFESIFLPKKLEKKEEKNFEEKKRSNWWIWAGIAILLTGAGLGIYAGTREEDNRTKFIISW